MNLKKTLEKENKVFDQEVTVTDKVTQEVEQEEKSV